MANDVLDLVFEEDEALSVEDGELFIDFDRIEELEVVPMGMYPTVITDALIKPVKKGDNAGKPMLVVKFTVSSEDYAGRKLTRNYVVLPTTLWAVKRLAKVADISPGKVSIAELAQMLIGQAVAVTVNHSMYMGELQADVSSVFAISSLEGQESMGDLFS